LERLSTSELLDIAASFGLDIPQGLERSFLIEELLEADDGDWDEAANPPAFSEDEEEFQVWGDGLSAGAKRRVTVPLPEQYNINFVDVLFRDPSWFFVMWEVRDEDRERFELSPRFKGYSLSVYDVSSVLMGHHPLFTVEVETNDQSRYLSFPLETVYGGDFYIELCVLMKDHEGVQMQPLARSRQFTLPFTNETVKPNKLQILSGFREMF
jgi:hypothetical protein